MGNIGLLSPHVGLGGFSAPAATQAIAAARLCWSAVPVNSDPHKTEIHLPLIDHCRHNAREHVHHYCCLAIAHFHDRALTSVARCLIAHDHSFSTRRLTCRVQPMCQRLVARLSYLCYPPWEDKWGGRGELIGNYTSVFIRHCICHEGAKRERRECICIKSITQS